MPLATHLVHGDALLASLGAHNENGVAGLQSPWITLRYSCTVLTPIYGGGERSGQLSEKGPRAPSIKGQLRSWWRRLNLARLGHDSEALFAQEAEIFGSARDEQTSGKAKVQVIASTWLSSINKSTKDQEAGKNGPLGLKYSLGVLSGVNPVLQMSGKFDLTVRISRDLPLDQQQGVVQALSWWAAFGGLGGRTRRGFGRLSVIEQTPAVVPHLQLVSPMDLLGSQSHPPGLAADNEFRLYEYGSATKLALFDHPLDALKKALGAYATFRQMPGLGRNPVSTLTNRPGRSRWPEPDVVRRLTGEHHPDHSPIHSAGNLVPRAAFGMPISIDFKSNGGKHGVEPAKTLLNPVKKGQYQPIERMASPLIFSVKPVKQADKVKWSAVLLVLPMEHITQSQLQVAVQYENRRKQLAAKPVDIWPWNNEAEQIRLSDTILPIRERRKLDPQIKDPVGAFAHYFCFGS